MDEPTTNEPVSAPTEPTAPSEPTYQAGGILVASEPVTPPVEPPVASQAHAATQQTVSTPKSLEPTQVTEPPKATEPKGYEPFNIPEGFDVPTDGFKQVAMKAGLNQSQAQAMIDYYCKEIIPARTQAVKQQFDAWRQESINQMGKQGMDMMNDLVNRLSKTNPLFAPLLRDTGLCYHPVVVKAFVDLASHMSEGTQGVPMSTYQSPQAKKDMASLLFPNSLK